MRAALALARRGLGRVWPNPAVGCVLVREGVVVGRGWTQPGGRPHAETEALARAGAAARGATAYVTLEPCSHTGRTPPCADALIAAGVARCVAALVDPDPRVAGRGLARMRAAGLAVEEGLEGPAAARLNAGFLLHRTKGRPLVTLKLATTLDGRIAAATGDSRWITGPQARERAHLMRATHDAVAVGIRTALRDDPDLTCRLPGMAGRSPVRVVLDGELRLPPGGRLAASAREVAVWAVTSAAAPADRAAALEARGVEVLRLPPGAGPPLAVDAALAALAARGITRLLVEGGAQVATSFFRAGLVDRLAWFRAGRVLGGDALPAFGPLGHAGVAGAAGWSRRATVGLGDDVLEIWAPPT